MMTLMITIILWFGFWNRARGSQIFGLTDSTTIARLVATWCMAFAASCILTPQVTQMIVVFAMMWAGLMLWCVPAWDNYWSVMIGDQQPPVKCFAPVDFIMGLPPFKWLKGRVWGLVALTLRMQLALPAFAAPMLYLGHGDRWQMLAGLLTLGIPYYISGYVSPRKYVIAIPEVVVGMIMGALAWAVIS